MTARTALVIVVALFVFMLLVLWLSKKLWPDMYDDYETLEWDEDIYPARRKER